MDRRSWPWRKKSSEKIVSMQADLVAGSSKGTAGNQENYQDYTKNVVSYIQLSQERYTYLSEMEDHVKVLNEQLSTTHSELSTKEKLIKQHTKVAEEAVSGWEKAEAEALALKNQLESVTLQKLSAEDRVAHLDDALKECLKQIRNVKEDSEQKLHDVVFAKTKQWEKIKFDLEEKINVFEQELLRKTAENDALSRSLEERSNMLINIREEKAQADAEIEILKTNIVSCEKELSSMKYEVHIVSKELEIRNEEKNMSVRSAEVANKQHLEDVKKIAKLEAECQRLRTLVRKKLPGPAALAQMKLEVESLGRDYGDNRLRRYPAKSSSPNLVAAPDLALENIQQCQRENEFLTARLLATEEETKMLKEALSKRNSELQASRNTLAKTASKIRSLESHMLVLSQQRSPSKSNVDNPIDGSLSQHESKPPSLTSMSEDGIDEEVSCSESWATALISELSHFKKEKDVDKSSKTGSSSHLELMDDFLEMERLACLSAESNGHVSVFYGTVDKSKIEGADGAAMIDATKDVALDTDLHSRASSKGGQLEREAASVQNEDPFSKIHSRIDLIFETQSKDHDMGKLLENLKNVVQKIEDELPRSSVICTDQEVHLIDAPGNQKSCHEDMGTILSIEEKPILTEDLKKTISEILDSVLQFVRYADSDGLAQKVGELSSVVNKVLSGEIYVDKFIVALSAVLSESTELGPRMFVNKDNERESDSPDCIDKVTLLENKIVQREIGKDRFSDSSSDPEILQGRFGPDNELKGPFTRYSLEEFEQLKVEKDNLVNDLACCSETLEHTKCQLRETEQRLADLQSQFATSQKSNSLAETQLKCMAESYRSLESRSHELENELKLLRSKAETLDNELQEERYAYQEFLTKYKDLHEQMERNSKCSVCSIRMGSDAEVKAKQEMEIAAAAEKLAECQETINLLGRHLKSLHPHADFIPPSPIGGNTATSDFSENILGQSSQGWPSTRLTQETEIENVSSSFRKGGESPMEDYGYRNPSEADASPISESPINQKLPKHRSSNHTEEKHGRGFSRFFSPKGKGNQ